MNQTAKGQRVEVRSLAGVEYGTVESLTHGDDFPQVTVHLDDDTYCMFPAQSVRPIQPTEDEMGDGRFPHECEAFDCTRTVQYDDEPYCFHHSPDSGSSVSGYSARARRAQR